MVTVEQLPPQSRQQRYLVPRSALTEQELDWLLVLKPGRHWSWAAEHRASDSIDSGGTGIAVATLDAFQGRSIGRCLPAAVAAEALKVGIQRLHGYNLPDNGRILG